MSHCWATSPAPFMSLFWDSYPGWLSLCRHPGWVWTCDPPASVAWVSGIIAMCPHNDSVSFFCVALQATLGSSTNTCLASKSLEGCCLCSPGSHLLVSSWSLFRAPFTHHHLFHWANLDTTWNRLFLFLAPTAQLQVFPWEHWPLTVLVAVNYRGYSLHAIMNLLCEVRNVSYILSA